MDLVESSEQVQEHVQEQVQEQVKDACAIKQHCLICGWLTLIMIICLLMSIFFINRRNVLGVYIFALATGILFILLCVYIVFIIKNSLHHCKDLDKNQDQEDQDQIQDMDLKTNSDPPIPTYVNLDPIPTYDKGLQHV